MNTKAKKIWLILLAAFSSMLLITASVLSVVQARQIHTLTDFIEVNLDVDLHTWDGTYVNGGAHTIYDDSAVVEAYHSGDSSKLDDEELYTLNTAKAVIEELGLTHKMSDYEKEKAIYDWQYNYVRYDSTQQSALPPVDDIEKYNYYPYGVLKYHQAICVGNATTFKLFMDMLEIENDIIHSTRSGEHAWNLVKLENDWYHVDLTFDGSDSDTPAYNNFNVSDAVKQNAGYPWDGDKYPQALGMKYSMPVLSQVRLADIYELPELLFKAQLQGEECLYVSFEDHAPLEMGLLDMIAPFLKDTYLYISQQYPLANGDNIYAVIFQSTAEEEEDIEQPDYYDMQKMTDIISDTFGIEAVG